MKEQGRGIAAVLVAFGAIAILLWLAVARLSPDTALGWPGILVACLAIGMGALGILMLRRSKD